MQGGGPPTIGTGVGLLETMGFAVTGLGVGLGAIVGPLERTVISAQLKNSGEKVYTCLRKVRCEMRGTKAFRAKALSPQRKLG